MKTAMHITTKVQPGHKVEIVVPELEEGETVEVTLTQPENTPPRRHILDVISELNIPPRSPEEWEQIEKEFQQERDSWDN